MSTFISYSRADSGFAVRLAKDLKSAGYDVWLDQLDIPTGARWDDEVEAALEACTTFMIILSAESIQSQNVKDEIAYAVDAGKDILPVRIKSGNIPLRLRRLQYVDFTDKPYEKSLKEIKSLLSTTGQLLTANEAEKKLSAAEAQPAAEKAPPPRPVPIPGARQPQVREPEVTGPPVAKKPWSRGLVMGMVAVAALVVAGVIINAIGTREPPVVTPPTGALVTENPPTEQPTAKPTLDTTQVAALTQTGQSEAITTKFLKSSDLADWEDFILGLGPGAGTPYGPRQGDTFHHWHGCDAARHRQDEAAGRTAGFTREADRAGVGHSARSRRCRRGTGEEDEWDRCRDPHHDRNAS